MSISEKKLKKTLPPKKVPAFLRSLGDVVAGQTDDLPPQLADVPLPVTKLEIKAKAREDGWTFKVKFGSEQPLATAAPIQTDEAGSPAASPANQPSAAYTALKRELQTAFNAIRDSIKGQQRPSPDVVRTFLSCAEDMLAFKGTAYGEPHYALFRQACRALAQAYESEDWGALPSRYAALAQLKKDCHKTYKGHRRSPL